MARPPVCSAPSPAALAALLASAPQLACLERPRRLPPQFPLGPGGGSGVPSISGRGPGMPALERPGRPPRCARRSSLWPRCLCFPPAGLLVRGLHWTRAGGRACAVCRWASRVPAAGRSGCKGHGLGARGRGYELGQLPAVERLAVAPLQSWGRKEGLRAASVPQAGPDEVPQTGAVGAPGIYCSSSGSQQFKAKVWAGPRPLQRLQGRVLLPLSAAGAPGVVDL